MRLRKIGDLEELTVFSEEFLKRHPQGAIVGLSGPLGSGKTTFVRTCIEILTRSLGRPLFRVTSPSFVIHQSYPLTPPIDHFDFYRLDDLDSRGLIDLGYFDTVERNKEQCGFIFVEWPERVANAEKLGLDLTLSFYFNEEGRTVEETHVVLR